MDSESNADILASRSPVERHFYLMVLQCPRCEKGPFELVSTERTPDADQDIWFARCRHCQYGQRLRFDRRALLIDESEETTNALPEVNPSPEPSRLIDLGQWLALFFSILSKASEEADRKEAQQLGYEATLCLEEALKFYRPDSDLPPPEAVWTPASRQRLKERPELFARPRLLQMREKLPSLQVMRKSITKPDKTAGNGHTTPPGKHWWSKWFKKE
jgi:hypothetical protein